MDMLIFSVSFQALTGDTQSKKDTITEMLRAIQTLTHVHQAPTLLTKQQNDQENEYPLTTVSHVKRSLHQTRRENEGPT